MRRLLAVFALVLAGACAQDFASSQDSDHASQVVSRAGSADIDSCTRYPARC